MWRGALGVRTRAALGAGTGTHGWVDSALRRPFAAHAFRIPTQTRIGSVSRQVRLASSSTSERPEQNGVQKDQQHDNTGESSRQEQSGQEHDEPKSDSFRRNLRRLIGVLTWLPVLYVVRYHVVGIASITGPSMSPTMNPAPERDSTVVVLNHFVVNRRWWQIKEFFGSLRWVRDYYQPNPLALHVGDVVLLVSPFDPNKLTCKRILALPGDIVTIRTDKEGSRSTTKQTRRIQIPPNHVWVEGDASVKDSQNSMRLSRDSRQYGPVHIALIQARVDMILWPWAKFGRIAPRPELDVEKTQTLRHVRRQRPPFAPFASRAHRHPDDSFLTPYVEWEWATNGHGYDGSLNSAERRDPPTDPSGHLQEHIEKSLRAQQRKRQGEAERDAKSKQFREMWNSLSRGGRLGDDAAEN